MWQREPVLNGVQYFSSSTGTWIEGVYEAPLFESECTEWYIRQGRGQYGPYQTLEQCLALIEG